MHYTFEVSKRFFILVILAKLMHLHTAVGFISNTTSAVGCEGSTAKIDFDFDLQGNTIVPGSKVWFFKRILIAEDTGSGFVALNNYSSRLTNHSSGLTLSNVMTADAGKYEHEITLVTGSKTETATASLTVYIGPTIGCSVYANQTGDLVTCYINTTGGSCGNPELKPGWMHLPDLPSSFICTQAGTYQCCATGPARTVCLPSSSYCVYFNCSAETTTPATTTKSSTTTTKTTITISATKTGMETTQYITGTQTVPTTTTSGTSTFPVIPVVIGIAAFILLIIIIIIICYCCRRRKDQNKEENGRELNNTNYDKDANNHVKL